MRGPWRGVVLGLLLGLGCVALAVEPGAPDAADTPGLGDAATGMPAGWRERMPAPDRVEGIIDCGALRWELPDTFMLPRVVERSTETVGVRKPDVLWTMEGSRYTGTPGKAALEALLERAQQDPTGVVPTVVIHGGVPMGFVLFKLDEWKQQGVRRVRFVAGSRRPAAGPQPLSPELLRLFRDRTPMERNIVAVEVLRETCPTGLAAFRELAELRVPRDQECAYVSGPMLEALNQPSCAPVARVVMDALWRAPLPGNYRGYVAWVIDLQDGPTRVVANDQLWFEVAGALYAARARPVVE